MARKKMLDVVAVAVVIALALSTARFGQYGADAFTMSPILESASMKPNPAAPGSVTPWKVYVPSYTSISCLLLSLSAEEAMSKNATSVTPSVTGLASNIGTDITKSDLDPVVPSHTNKAKNLTNDHFFIRPALLVDMNRASKILADAFFKGPNTNWITFQYEKLVTYLSLEANFPKSKQQRFRYEIFVACDSDSGTVVGMVEIDARGLTDERTSKVFEKSGGSAYMCNLAVDEKQRRKGIATFLVYECERQVRKWHSEDKMKETMSGEKTDSESEQKSDLIYDTKNEIINDIFGDGNNKKSTAIKNKMSDSVCLKVRETDKAAVQMYRKLGYSTISQEIAENPNNNKTKGKILLMKKALSSDSPSSQSSSSFSTDDQV
mmetsp:Transcript_9601/g.28671  ORF Transcript_9601/g.28671 Transcript_9601/m.28671 type:complete len:378 (+) Transcript_9601:303-1436(+)|eukprot:CAMPEP_0172375336 /NCGR_PEP_ID=MMETSP1060-20121228/61101_1 /TAXON_ID=37318 /ORGANISM="Pseudo-nitzschia pungens, Strain cf. cingulata" /LENGTH=377 /DNA_ID=CAMNT_0013102417 /DNA_START=280 /DNA_END=1413 /DNA_ORIENTATION=+